MIPLTNQKTLTLGNSSVIVEARGKPKLAAKPKTANVLVVVGGTDIDKTAANEGYHAARLGNRGIPSRRKPIRSPKTRENAGTFGECKGG